MNERMSDAEARMDAQLRMEGRREVSGAGDALADRLIAGLRDPRPYRAQAWAMVALVVVGVASLGAAWMVSLGTPAREQMAERDPLLEDHPIVVETPEASGVDADPIVTMIDEGAEDLLEPLKRELRVLAAISRDSWRSIAGFAPVELRP